MPNIGSLWQGRRHSRPPRNGADILAEAIGQNPPVHRDAEDAAYLALFGRLADQALVSYRTGRAVGIALDAEERLLLGTELSAIVAGLRCYLQHMLGLSGEPHIECDFRGGVMALPIELRVTR